MDGACAVKKREKKNRPAFFRFLPVRLSPEEAKRQIDDILRRYGESCSIIFRETDAEIKDSFLVDSKLDRHMICEIITRTGLTRRSYEDLSAEWEFHNAAFSANIERGSARDVSLDYGKDPRRIVRWATKIFDFFNIE